VLATTAPFVQTIFDALRTIFAEGRVGRRPARNAATPADRLAALVEECRALVSAEAQRKAAQSRRDVILQGLAKLGYEVHEGMTTAWAKDGRVVLRKPSLPGYYGVEASGQAETSRLQVRAVALSGNRDVNRDKDVEKSGAANSAASAARR
jgi:hypothetical protein